MKDKWMNMGYEEEELLPFKEPTLDISDQKRIEILIGMGYPRQEIEESLRLHKFDDCYASYLLLGRKSTDVSIKELGQSTCHREMRRCYIMERKFRIFLHFSNLATEKSQPKTSP